MHKKQIIVFTSLISIHFSHPMEKSTELPRDEQADTFTRILTLAEENNASAQYIVADCYQSEKGYISLG